MVLRKFGWVILLGVLLWQGCESKPEKPKIPEKGFDLKDASIVMIIAPDKFRDEKYQVPRTLFDKSGVKVVVASSSLKESTGMKGLKVKPDVLIDQVGVTNFDAVVFVGGVGAKEYFDNKTAHELARKAVEQNKILGAICIAPSILANAGLLKNRKATAFRTEADNLKAKNADYTAEDVTRDGNIITGNGPAAAQKFAETIAQTLTEVIKKK